MKLTKHELTRLGNFQRARECAPTMLGVLWRVNVIVLALIAVSLIGYFVADWLTPWPWAAYLILGFGAGALWSIGVIAYIVPQFWPLTREVLNWERIEQLIKEQEDKSA
jgi:hypothetical protein